MTQTAEQLETEPDETPLVPEPETEEPPEGDEEGPDGAEPDTPDEQEQPIAEEAVAEAQEPERVDDVDALAKIREVEKMERSLEKRASTYVLAVDSFVETTEQPFIRCGCCLSGLPGYLVSPAVAAPSEDQVKFARALAGMPEIPPLVQGQNVRECPACQGWGDVLTGSKRNDQTKMRCNTCQGRGFVGEGPAAQPSLSPVASELPPAPLDTAAEDTAKTDPWGRPPEHPGYMIMPHEGMDAALKPAGWA